MSVNYAVLWRGCTTPGFDTQAVRGWIVWTAVLLYKYYGFRYSGYCLCYFQYFRIMYWVGLVQTYQLSVTLELFRNYLVCGYMITRSISRLHTARFRSTDTTSGIMLRGTTEGTRITRSILLGCCKQYALRKYSRNTLSPAKRTSDACTRTAYRYGLYSELCIARAPNTRCGCVFSTDHSRAATCSVSILT